MNREQRLEYGSDIRVNFICGNGKLYTWCVANNLPNVISSKLPHRDDGLVLPLINIQQP
jgi:hypothetical protein